MSELQTKLTHSYLFSKQHALRTIEIHQSWISSHVNVNLPSSSLFWYESNIFQLSLDVLWPTLLTIINNPF
jgi:hypothetical protein